MDRLRINEDIARIMYRRCPTCDGLMREDCLQCINCMDEPRDKQRERLEDRKRLGIDPPWKSQD